MNIVPARTDQLADLSEMARRAMSHWGYPASILDAWMGELTVSAPSLEQRPTFVAEWKGKVVGFYQLSADDGRWELEHFWVDPLFMRRSIGRHLLAHAVDVAARSGADFLSIDADPHAERFYVSCGAVRTGAVPAPIQGDRGRVRPQLRIDVATPPGNG